MIAHKVRYHVISISQSHHLFRPLRQKMKKAGIPHLQGVGYLKNKQRRKLKTGLSRKAEASAKDGAQRVKMRHEITRKKLNQVNHKNQMNQSSDNYPHG